MDVLGAVLTLTSVGVIIAVAEILSAEWWRTRPRAWRDARRWVNRR